MNLSDPELELVDPTPNVHLLFLHFDRIFFWTKLSSRAVVRWSKRMYSCAGTCSYDRGGLCDIALSEPLLKLRPRKDLIETLLHEMIHAFLFVTHRDQNRDGHGPNFKEHMHRINKAAGLNITIYHDFHQEVELYLTHWWRCNGPCQKKRPHFGIVRRSANRVPGPSDYWWKSHERNCGGTFVKIKEPENYGKGKNKMASPNPSGDITKYINTNNNNNTKNDKVLKPVLKDSNSVPVKSNINTKHNRNSTIVVTKKKNIVFNPQSVKSPVVFSGKGQTIGSTTWTNSADVTETVRNIWANKQLSPTIPNKNTQSKETLKRHSTGPINSIKHKADDINILSPPPKIKKIDDYFKSAATSLLKDLYGKDFEIKETNNNKRLSVVHVNVNLVDCPVCSIKVSSEIINRHLDECLNKQVIDSICEDICVDTKTVINMKSEIDKSKEFDSTASISVYTNSTIKQESDLVQLSNIKTENIPTDFNSNKINSDKVEYKPTAIIKTEPGTSKDVLVTINEQKCPCCGHIISKSINEHLEECLAFFNTDTTTPKEGTSLSETIFIDEDDIHDETLTLNSTGTKLPCPCCLKMIEEADMNDHLDLCLS